MEPLHQVNLEQYKEAIKADTVPVVIKVSASWCSSCSKLKPIVEEIADNNKGIVFLEVDADKTPEIPTELKIMNIPVLIMFKNAKEIARLAGFQTKEKIQEFINNNYLK